MLLIFFLFLIDSEIKEEKMKKINVILVLFISLLVLFWKVPNAYANSHTYTVSHTKTFS
ncbi:hypothetical protein IV80_GL001462 [Pediococcus cellicola]|uniref:Uncharacterized protein n=1 Tax=Pediococcus cellicola TaxID=319652 RepID=A0A0R2IRU6_9LACO|nr:hypothetical protein IV80_GL001462 [Pediococcus cellicola]